MEVFPLLSPCRIASTCSMPGPSPTDRSPSRLTATAILRLNRSSRIQHRPHCMLAARIRITGSTLPIPSGTPPSQDRSTTPCKKTRQNGTSTTPSSMPNNTNRSSERSVQEPSSTHNYGPSAKHPSIFECFEVILNKTADEQGEAGIFAVE